MNKRGVKFGIVLTLIVRSSKLEVGSELASNSNNPQPTLNIELSTFNSDDE